MASETFLGKGMKFPPQINPATGKFEVSSEADNVKESVYIILMTNIGERFLRPNFGSSLQSYTFMDVNITNLSFMIRTLTEQILKQEPRISEVDISVDSVTRKGCLIIDINYTLAKTNDKDNLVFPFYLDTIVEEEANESVQYQNGGYNEEPIEEITN